MVKSDLISGTAASCWICLNDGPDVGKVKESNAGLTEDRGHGGGNLLEEGLDMDKVRDASMETEVNKSLSLNSICESIRLPLSFLPFLIEDC